MHPRALLLSPSRLWARDERWTESRALGNIQKVGGIASGIEEGGAAPSRSVNFLKVKGYCGGNVTFEEKYFIKNL